LEQLLIGLQSISSVESILIILTGICIGLVFGIIPGLGPTVAATLLISFTYSMDPTMGILLVASVYVAGTFGGSQTAIIYNIPGSAENSCAALDGYKLTKKGKASDALGAAIFSSAIGGIIGCVVLFLFAPALSQIAYLFGSFDYFALAMFGLVAVICLQQDLLKGLISALIGVVIGMIGISSIDASKVFTLGFSELYGGIKLIPVMLGMYVVAEVFHQAFDSFKEKYHFGAIEKIKNPSFKIINKIKGVIARSSIVGILIGILPGVGAVLANYIGYSLEEKMQSTGKGQKTIGSGDIKGVAAPEAANNAAAVATFIPMLALGIPGGAVTAILLGVFEMHGIQPGPLLFTNYPNLVYTLFIGLLIVNILIVPIGFLEIKIVQRLLHIKKGIIFSVMLTFAVVGAFVVSNNIVDVYSMLIFGLIGFKLKENGYSVPIIILGMVLGDLLGNNYARMVLSGFAFSDIFSSYIGLSFLVLSILFVAVPIIKNLKKNKEAKS